MRKILISFLAAVCLLSSFSSYAHLAMALRLNARSYLKYEQIYSRLVVRNQSGQPIVFGVNEKLQGTISFQIETLRGQQPKRLESSLFKIQDTMLQAGERENFDIPLTQYFMFTHPGKYRVRAIVSHAQLDNDYMTEYVEFNIVDGHIVWSTQAGIPLEDKEKIDKRTYSIISYYDGRNKVLCLQVDDKSHIYGLTKIGYEIGTGKPECQVDRLSKLHILLQNSASIYSYFVYDTNCVLEKKEVYKKIDDYNVPTLFKDDKTGRISVINAMLAVNGTDYTEESLRVK